MGVEAVFLDFGGTLADRSPDVWTILLEVCAENGVSLTRKDVDVGRALADRSHRSVQFQTAELMEGFWVGWFRLILESLGVEDGLRIAQDAHRRIKDETKIRLYSEVSEVLPCLRELAPCMGIVSNYNCMLEPNCMGLGIASYFDFILASDLIRSGKPQRLIFDLAVRESGAHKEACLHVGDSLGADYNGAEAAGLQALLLDRFGSGVRVSPIAEDLWGVVDFLEDLA